MFGMIPAEGTKTFSARMDILGRACEFVPTPFALIALVHYGWSPLEYPILYNKDHMSFKRAFYGRASSRQK